MRIGTAEKITAEETEAGFELHILTEEGIFVVNVHGVSDDLVNVGLEVGGWYDPKPRTVFACNPDESAGYAPTDPKHPDWHSVHADLYDAS